jgi:hypothetical protein
MKNQSKDYTLRDGKDASIMNKRQAMGERQHSETNSFVKAEQMKSAKFGGRAPDMDGRYMKLDASMMNNGAHAQEFAKKLTASIDHEAFPVRQNPDMSQD